jgi:hypothetical protein
LNKLSTDVIKTSPLAPLLAKERGTRKTSFSPSPCKGEGNKKNLFLTLSL